MTTKKNRRGPGKQTMTRIREAFNPADLIRVCELDDFSKYAPRTPLDGDSGLTDRFYYFKDNGSKILAVAHLDHVQANSTTRVTDTAAGPLVTSGALDDRLGAYVILELLPALGITCDWLLTTDEEVGASTAAEFPDATPGFDKDYNWIIEFDRGGTDVVMYQYETEELAGLVENSGARVGMGSYSDISVLDHLGCAAFNWGVGYENYHSPRAHAFLEDTFRMVAYFLRFYDTNSDVHLEHKPVPKSDGRYWWEIADDEDALNDWWRDKEREPG